MEKNRVTIISLLFITTPKGGVGSDANRDYLVRCKYNDFFIESIHCFSAELLEISKHEIATYQHRVSVFFNQRSIVESESVL